MRLLVIFLILAAVSCSNSEKPKRAIPVKFPPADPTKNKTGQPMEVGTIESVNQKAGFVLVKTNGYAPPPAGVTLKSVRAGKEVSVLKVSAERRREFFTADIVSGEPQRGDKALQ